MATEVKAGLYYSQEHEWVRVDGEQAYIGLTDFAQQHLGDIVFVELPEVGGEYEAMAAVGTIESVKAVSDMHTPVSGIVAEVNSELEDTPELLNQDPYGNHIVVLRMADRGDLKNLMQSGEYAEFCDQAEEQE